MNEAPEDLHHRLDQLRLLATETTDPLAERLVRDMIAELEDRLAADLSQPNVPPRISDVVINEQRDQMPRYYFHIRNADGMARDEEGTDLPDLDSAYKAALVCARELMAIGVKEGADRMPESILITDASGREVATVGIRDVLPSHRQI